jgi:hypothetical protein
MRDKSSGEKKAEMRKFFEKFVKSLLNLRFPNAKLDEASRIEEMHKWNSEIDKFVETILGMDLRKY